MKRLETEVFDGQELVHCMETQWAGRKVVFYNCTDSTNVRAKEAAEDGAAHGTLIVADRQTSGLGRRGRSWESPGGINVYATLLLRPDCAVDKVAAVTLVMALAVSEAIKELCGVDAGIKWPNDIVADGKKICGILTEMSVDKTGIRYVIIGFGINVGMQEFAQEVAKTATSLEQECGKTVSRTELLARVMKAFEKYDEIFMQTQDMSLLLEAYNSRLVNCGREVRVLDPKGEFRGIAKGITATGELLVELADKTVTEVYAGEVSVRGIYGYV